MIGVLSEWVRTLAVGAAFCGVVLLLIPEGAEKRATRLTCALMLTILLIAPLRRLDTRQLTELLTMKRMETAGFTEDADELSMELCTRIIREEIEEYIWDAARKLGVTELGIRLRLRETGELPCPWSIALTGTVTEEQKEKLSLLLEGELGIPRQRQTWSADDAD